MKKAISLLTALTLALSLALPASAMDSGKMQELIQTTKAVLEIPEEFKEFSSNAYTDEKGETTWHFNWSKNNNGPDYGNISVEIAENGFIRGYYRYDGNRKYSEIVQLPEISKDQAEAAVRAFIQKVAPQLDGQFDWEAPAIANGDYTFVFYRKVNGITADFHTVTFTVSGTTGKVDSYQSYWDDKLDFPAADQAISAEDAKKAYEELLPFDLEYRLNNDGKIYLRYTPSRKSGSYYLDALTGKLEKTTNSYELIRAGYAEMAMKSSMGGYMDNSLTPEERVEVDTVAGLISVADAEKALRDVSEFALDASYKLNSSGLSRYKEPHQDTATYNYSLHFSKIKDAEGLSQEQMNLKIAAGDVDGYAYASVDAKTGRILSFSSDYTYPRPLDAKKTEEAKAGNKKIAEAFIDKYLSDKKAALTESVLDSGRNAGYQYDRKVNGAYFLNDGVWISVNDEGKISTFHFTWTENTEVPATDGAISVSDAHKKVYDKAGFILRYIPADKKAALTYAPGGTSTHNIDAFTGELIDYNGRPLGETKAPQYQDLDGHFSAEAVKALADAGVYLAGDGFDPDSGIKQKDYLTLLSKLGKYYRSSDALDELYKFLVHQKILTEAEKDPDGAVTRENAVKYLLRYLDYGKFAEIKGIFYLDFADADQIDPALVGYASIAKGLGFVQGSNGNFYPKSELTRGEAAVIIYNALKTIER